MNTRSIATILGSFAVLLVLWFYLTGTDTHREPAPEIGPNLTFNAPPQPLAQVPQPLPPPAQPVFVAPEESPPPEAPSVLPIPPETDVEIKIEYPKPTFLSIPVAMRMPNLEPPGSYIPPNSFRAPHGTLNAALGKPVISSDPSPIIGSLELITDGDASGLDGAYVELAPGPQWVQVDLESEVAISKIMVWHYHKEPRAYVDVIVQVSSDPNFTSGVATVFNSDHDNTLAQGAGSDLAYLETNHGRIIDCGRTMGRYVRLSSNGSSQDESNHYCEVAVYGIPTP